jgi:hypothetical protein
MSNTALIGDDKMRVARRETLTSILVLSMFIVTITFVPEIAQLSLFNTNQNVADERSSEIIESSPPIENKDLVPEKSDYSALSSDSPANGILNPLTVEQSGYAASGNISARTDNYQNLEYNLPLDAAHNWIADEAEVSVWNLQKLYAVNGSFDEGIPGINAYPNGSVAYHPLGWDANSTDTDTYADDVQIATYDSSGRKFVVVESQGGKVGQTSYAHVAGTRIVWSQFVQNTPYTEDFQLSFDYSYIRGPIDGPTGLTPVVGNCSLALFIDGAVVWNMSLLLLSQRGVWYSLKNNPITISGVPSSFTLELGLVIDETLTLNYKTADYDGDPGHLPDGVGNAAYITVYLDDVSFTKAIPPTPQEVQLEFATGGVSTPVAGSSGLYSATLVNSSYWVTSPVSIALSSNTSVSFDYKARLYSHRFTDSNWRTDISSIGVSYEIDHGSSSFLVFYAYVGYLGNYEEPEMTITFPTDWENVTVSDPFLADLTINCTVGSGYLAVPTSIINRLGWWEFKLESPNYAKSIKSQIFDVIWSDYDIFRIGNTTRANITIGTSTQTLGSLTDVNVTWFKPADIVWVSELISGGSSGQINSTQQTFASGSSPAGEWWVEVYWINGTEVAYDRAQFKVYHTTELIADPKIITTDTGLTVTGIVRYTDGDTGANLLDPSAIITGYWSAPSVLFVPNTIHNWWEGTFDTSLVGEGEFTIVVNASRLYYDDISCQITLQSTRVTRLSSPNAPWTADEWGHTTQLTFNYEFYDYTTSSWGPISNDTSVSMSLNWTAGFWSAEESTALGIYTVNVSTGAKNSGTWLLNVTFSKPDYQTKTIFLTLIVSPATSSLSILGDISARVNLDEDQSVKLTYRGSGGNPISGANVVIDSVSPSTGLGYTTVDAVSGEPGNYSASLTPHAAGVFTIRLVATEANSEPAIAVFVLVVNDLATILDISGPASVEIGLTDVYNTTFSFALLNGTGISNAQINITYSGENPGALSYGWVDLGMGDYSVEFSSTKAGTYLITIAASKPYFQSDSDAFFLVVREITSHLTSLNGTADIVGFSKSYALFVNYTSNLGVGLSNADVGIESVVPATGLSWENATEESAGLYSILLTPLESKTFTILVKANLSDYQTQFVLFTLTATAIATSLTVLDAGTTISLDQNFTVNLLFQDEDFNGLENATLSIQNAAAGALFSEFEPLGSGYYRVTITPLEVGTFDVVFKASKNGYQNGYGSFTLGAIRIPTNLHLTHGSSEDSVMFSLQYPLFVLYERTDTHLNVTGATIDIQASPETGFNYSYSEQDSGYLILIETTKTGRWTLTITAQKAGYSSGSLEFILDVNPIPIHVELLSDNSVTEGQLVDIIVRLTQEGTTIPISNATVMFRVSESGTGPFTEMHETDTPGVYAAQFSLQLYLDATDYLLEITVEKDNYIQPQEVYQQPFFKITDTWLRMAPIVYGGSGIGFVMLGLFVMMHISSRRKKKRLQTDLANKRRFDDADNIIGVIILHKKSGIPIYSRMMKGGFEEGIVAAFITAITHFREEFEMFDTESMAVIPISDIIRAVQTRNLICAFVTVKSASIEHNRNIEDYARQVARFLDDLLDGRPEGVIDQKIADMLDYIFNTTMDGFLLQYYKVATSEKFPKRYQLLDDVLHDTDTRHCTKPILLAKSMASYGVTEARGCTLVMEAIQNELIVLCTDEETETIEFKFADFFAQPDRSADSEA